MHGSQQGQDVGPEGLLVEFSERLTEWFRFITNGLLWGACFGGLAAILIDIFALPESNAVLRGSGLALLIGGAIGVYMMSGTKKIASRIYGRLDNISDKIDTMSEQVSGKLDTVSGKLDTMSEQVSGKLDTMSGKIDTMSEQVSGKLDTVSGKLDTMSEQVSGKLDTVSGKLDTMSEQVSGKLDTMSEQVSGKLDTMSGKIDNQTDVLKEIRDAVVGMAVTQKQAK